MPQPGLCPQPSRAGWQQDGSGAGCQAAGRRSQEGCLLMRLWGFRCWCGAVEDAELCCWCSRLRAGLASLIGSKWLCTRNKQLARSHAKPCCPLASLCLQVHQAGHPAPAAQTPGTAQVWCRGRFSFFFFLTQDVFPSDREKLSLAHKSQGGVKALCSRGSRGRPGRISA